MTNQSGALHARPESLTARQEADLELRFALYPGPAEAAL